MSYSQKYTIVQFLEPSPEDNFFIEDWPLHITMADVFALEVTDTLLEQLYQFLASEHNIETKAQGIAELGSEENPVSVTLIKNTPELQLLHEKLVGFLESNGAVFNTPAYTRDGFLPHSTVQKRVRLDEGETVKIAELSLIDMFVDEDWQKRRVIDIFQLQATD